MLGKYFTVVVIPQKTSKVSKFKIPVRLFSLFALLIFTCLFILGWVFYDYLTLKTQFFNLQEQQAKYQKQQEQFKAYNQQMHDLDLDLDRLNEFNQKLRVLTNLEVAAKNKKLSKEELIRIQEMEKLAHKSVLDAIDTDVTESVSDQTASKKRFDNLAEFIENKDSLYSRIPNAWPVKGLLIAGFGYQADPFSGQVKPHNGINISSRPFSLFYAPAKGIVTFVGEDESYGQLLIIDHGYGLITKYSHVSAINVEAGDIITRGQALGTIGNRGGKDGISQGSYLHYEVLLNNIPQNPILYIQEAI